MERRYDLIMRKLLALITLILLAFAIFGCSDSHVANVEAKHTELCQLARQEMQNGGSAFQPISQNEALFPAQ